MTFWRLTVFIIILLFCSIYLCVDSDDVRHLPRGGHTVSFCATGVNPQIPYLKQCQKTNGTCEPPMFHFKCLFPCRDYVPTAIVNKNFGRIIFLKINEPQYEVINREVDSFNSTLKVRMKTKYYSFFQTDEFYFKFHSTNFSIFCENITFTNKIINCLLNVKNLNAKKVFFNVSIGYGLKECSRVTDLGLIQVIKRVQEYKLEKYYFILIGVVAVILLISLTIVIIKGKKNAHYAEINQVHQKELEAEVLNFSKLQKKAFLEYQTAVNSFTSLGSLTARQLLPFDDYISRLFNLELSKKTDENIEIDESFEKVLLSKEKLLHWIKTIENSCSSAQRSVAASLLTLVLFQHPGYFMDIMKTLTHNVVARLQRNSEEKLLFRRSEAIVEMLINNWLSICMYQNFKAGEIGKRFFNLYRAIKCKINQGLVDCITEKAKYALTFEYILVGDLECETMKIYVNVKLKIKLLNKSESVLIIEKEMIEVEVLSLDSISQVKTKILDRAIMFFSESENKNETDDAVDCISTVDEKDFCLYFLSNATKIGLNDFDSTSVASDLEKENVVVNTMKHYNMKSGNRFLLESITVLDTIDIASSEGRTNSLRKQNRMHLHLPPNLQNNPELMKHASDKFLFNPLSENISKDSSLMILMATKKSLSQFIDGFFQCIMDWKPDYFQTSSNSLFQMAKMDSTLYLPENSNNSHSQFLVSKESYLMPICYLFGMLDDVAKSLSIKEEVTLHLWKSNSFILRFWINMIKNPNFIFSIDKSRIMDGCLTTIATVLMESCSVTSNIPIDVDIPVVKQLFHEDVKDKYSQWWRSFIESPRYVSEDLIISIMKQIAEETDLQKHYRSSMRSLKIMSDKFVKEI